MADATELRGRMVAEASDGAWTTVWTIGHSTRTFDAFVTALRAYAIELVVDIRRFPGSRRLPQFGGDALRTALDARGIAYEWLPSLGGRRAPHPGSHNTGWRHPAFRGYADHMESEAFAEGLFALAMLAGGARTAIMCAEMLWWQCHRRLVADVLTALAFEVVHIRDERDAKPHRLAPPARIVRGALRYDEASAHA
jgi:uncharacterized protein (DUF488 family)